MRDAKQMIFKKRRRKNSRRLTAHRQVRGALYGGRFGPCVMSAAVLLQESKRRRNSLPPAPRSNSRRCGSSTSSRRGSSRAGCLGIEGACCCYFAVALLRVGSFNSCGRAGELLVAPGLPVHRRAEQRTPCGAGRSSRLTPPGLRAAGRGSNNSGGVVPGGKGLAVEADRSLLDAAGKVRAWA